jgi:hypothetical protein
MTIPCPDCRNQIAMPAAACPGCGLRLVGADAARLWEVDLALGSLATERVGLIAGLRPSAPTPVYSPAFLPAYPQPATPPLSFRHPARALRPMSPQQLLLGLGAALLLVASVVFVAVAWTSLGRVVQAGVMVCLTAGTTWAAAVAVRKSLQTTAESLGVIASGLVAIDAWAAWTLNVANLQRLSPATYAALGATAATLLLAGAARVIPQVKTFGVVAVMSAQAAVLAAVVAGEAHHHRLPVLLAGALVALSVVDRLVAHRSAGPRRATALVFAVGGWAVGAAVGTYAAAAADGVSSRIGLVVLAAAAICLLPPFNADVRTDYKAVVSVGGLTAGVLDARFAAAALGGVVALCLLGVAGAALMAVSSKLHAAQRWIFGIGVGTVMVTIDALAAPQPHSLASIVGAAAGIGFLTHGLFAAADRRWAWPAGAASLIASAAAAMVTAHATSTDVDAMVVIAGAGVLGAAAMCRRRPEEVGFMAIAGVASLIGVLGLLHHHELAYAGGALALTGCAWLMFAALPERAEAIAPALVALALAQICALAAPATKPIDYLTVGLGVLVIAISVVHREAAQARLLVATAGVTLAVLPSAYLSLVDGGLTRPLAVAAAGVVLVWLASERPNPALFGCSAITIGLAAAGLADRHHFSATAAVLGAAAAVVAAHAILRRRYLGIEIPVAAALVTASLASTLSATHFGTGPSAVVLAAIGAVWGAVRIEHQPAPRQTMRAISGATSVFAIITATDARGWLSITLAITGATWLTFAAQRGGQAWAFPGVIAVTAALWHFLFNSGVHDVEAYTVPLATLLLAIGLINLERSRETASWVTAGPAVVVGLVPSAFTAIFDPNALRPMLVVVASSLLILAGLQLRWRALILPAAWCLGAVVFVQLAPYAVGAPRWLTLGGVGAVLVAAGARYERRLHDVRTIRAWYVGLH